MPPKLINKIYINIWINIPTQLYINIWTNIHYYWLLYRIGGRAGYLKKIINYIIYFKYILNILVGWVRSSLAGLEFYDPNPTRPAIKISFCNPTQPNPTHQALKTNPTRRVGSGRFWRIGGLAAHPYHAISFDSMV